MDESVEEAEIRIITEPITKADAQIIGKHWYSELVKGVVDIEKNILALGGEYHMDANVILIAQGSAQANVWGFNIYPTRPSEKWIEFISLINIRPAVGNTSMLVEDEEIQNKMRAIIETLIV